MNNQFKKEKEENIQALSNNSALKKQGMDFVEKTAPNKYTYNFTWLGRPIIQFPQDMVALQELIWDTKPDLIIETGIAHGGSLILSASMLQLIGGDGKVLGIDIDIREHNRKAIEEHPMSHRIDMIQGSSVDQSIVDQVKTYAEGKSKIMVILDSNHTHEHVLEELKAYADLVTKGCYLIVFDTSVEDMPDSFDWNGRPWAKGDNPKTAVWEFLKENKDFEIDGSIDGKLLITVAPDGYLKRIN
jgi:cephalosporin hydroxylase